MSRNKLEGRYAGKFAKIPWDVTQPHKDCRTGPGERALAYSLKEWGGIVKEINSKRRKQ